MKRNWLSTTYALAYVLALTSHSYTGVLNCTGNEVFTKYEFPKKVAYELGYPNAKIKKGASVDVLKVAKRPLHSNLNDAKLRSILNIKIHNLHEVLSGPEFDEYRS